MQLNTHENFQKFPNANTKRTHKDPSPMHAPTYLKIPIYTEIPYRAYII